MKDLYYVAQEISKQKNLKGNLLKYATGMASMYTGLAYMKLSMNYYTCLLYTSPSPRDTR